MARPLSETAHNKILDAAAELIADRGMDQLSMDAVARKAGASKATIYNHWTDKEALLLEVLKHVNGINTRPDFNTGNTHADIVAVLSHRPREHAALRDRIQPHLMAYSATRAEFGMAWRNTVMDPPRRELRKILEGAIARGEVTEGLDFDLALAMLLGPMLYSFIFRGKTPGHHPTDLADGIATAFLRAFGKQKPSRSRTKTA